MYAESCVAYIHDKTGAPLVDAEFYKGFPGSIPSIGSVVVFFYPKSSPDYQWHVALVKEFKRDCFLISERNFDGKGSYGERCIPYNHPSIVKFWTPPGIYPPTWKSFAML